MLQCNALILLCFKATVKHSMSLVSLVQCAL